MMDFQALFKLAREQLTAAIEAIQRRITGTYHQQQTFDDDALPSEQVFSCGGESVCTTLPSS